MTPKTRRGDRTHDEILAAATDVVLKQGPDAFSLREVARRADLAPSALYNHFPSRDALILAIARRALDDLKAYLGEAPAEGDAAMRLRSLGAQYSRFAREHANEYRLIFECLKNPPTDWETYLAIAEPFSLIVNACADGLRDGEFVDRADVGAGGMAYGLWALVHGHASLTSRNLAHVEGDFDALCSAAIESVLAGWAAPAKGA
jgi:AcrR family transcriptional regulator